MIRKTMFLGDYAAEFHLDHKSDPPRYNYAIIMRHSRALLFWGRGASVEEVMRLALERLERYHGAKVVLPDGTKVSPGPTETLMHVLNINPEQRVKMKAVG